MTILNKKQHGLVLANLIVYSVFCAISLNSLSAKTNSDTKTTNNKETKDTYVSETDSTSFNQEPELIVGNNSQIFIAFILPNKDPDAELTQAKLRLYQNGATGKDNAIIQLKTIAQTWNDATVTWATKPDTESLIEQQTLVSQQGWVDWENAKLKKEIEDWYASPSDNFSVSLSSDDSDEFSRTFSSSNNADNPPVIELVFETQAPPIITNPESDETQTSAIISWLTDEDATSLVNYGTTDAYSDSKGKPDSELTMDHEIIIENLNPDTEYHFQIQSTNAEKLTATNDDLTFNTLAAVNEEEKEENIVGAEQELDPADPTQQPQTQPTNPTTQADPGQVQQAQQAAQQQYAPPKTGEISLDGKDALGTGTATPSKLEQSKNTFLKIAPWITILAGIIVLFRLSISGYLSNSLSPNTTFQGADPPLDPTSQSAGDAGFYNHQSATPVDPTYEQNAPPSAQEQSYAAPPEQYPSYAMPQANTPAAQPYQPQPPRKKRLPHEPKGHVLDLKKHN